MDNDDSRQSLFDEFESEIVKAANPEAFFDETDLVEIFDYASDLDNYIVKMEVLLYGARHYPDSQALATRRAWFYSSFGEMDAATTVNNRVREGGVLNKLLALKAEGPDENPTTRVALDAIVRQTEAFADEDVIQLVDFCAERNLLDWVRDNRSKIEAKTPYPQTFIYEYADRAEDAGDYETAEKLFEELTMMEPFTTDFWLRLGAVQYEAKKFEAALNSADYALAIDSVNIEALTIRAKSLYWLDRDMAEVIRILSDIVLRPESTEDDIRILAFAKSDTGDSAGAVESLTLFLDTHAPSRVAMDCLLVIDLATGVKYAEKFFVTTQTDGGAYSAWAEEHFRLRNYAVAAELFRIAAEQAVTPENIRYMLEAYYLAGEYLKAVKCFERYVVISEKVWIHYPTLVFPYLMSLVRLGKTQYAIENAKAIHENFLKMCVLVHNHEGLASPCEFHTLNQGYSHYLTRLITSIGDPSLSPDDYDPMMV